MISHLNDLQGFDEKRREVRAEKQKKIRELTDPNHAWDAPVKLLVGDN